MKLAAVALLFGLASPVVHAQWVPSEHRDPMTDQVSRIATIRSTGRPATLRVRQSPGDGLSVWITLDSGQFAGIEGHQILVRFDDGKALPFWTASAADGSTHALFIPSAARFRGVPVDKVSRRDRERFAEQFVEMAHTARRIRIQADVYREGSPILDFAAPQPLSGP